MPIPTTIRPEKSLRMWACALAAVLVGWLAISPTEPERAAVAPAVARPARPVVTVSTVYDALEQCRRAVSEIERWRIAATVYQEALRYGYDPLFIAAIVEVESQCRPSARGVRGAVGLVQIRPATARAMAEESGLPWKGEATLRDGVSNLRLGVRYLWTLEEQFDDPHLAIAAYNLGPTRVAAMSRQRARGAQYVKRVLARYHDLVEQYGV